MRKLAITMALASTALATPALARDNTWYVGVEGGLSIVRDVDFDAVLDLNGVETEFDNEVKIDHKRGVDLDLIGGYDFGAFRAEAEAGYKRASLDEITFNPEGSDPTRTDLNGSVRVYSAMINLLADFGSDNGWNGYIGGGVGLANVRYKLAYATPGDIGSGSDSDRSIAFQGIAGVRTAISQNVDLGLKYRYFVAPKLDYNIDFGQLEGKFKSHSLLASLIFNFAPPPPPPVIVDIPPPPPPPPATQTCDDGSVILATDVCPAPPPPPPPPPPEPAPERG